MLLESHVRAAIAAGATGCEVSIKIFLQMIFSIVVYNGILVIGRYIVDGLSRCLIDRF